MWTLHGTEANTTTKLLSGVWTCVLVCVDDNI